MMEADFTLVLGVPMMDVVPRSAPMLLVKPTRRSTQVGLFWSLRGSCIFCLYNSLIKTALQLYLHTTFSHPRKLFQDK